MATALYHLTPALPPAINGLGDYALLLAGALRDLQLDSVLIAPGIQPPTTKSFAALGLAEKSERALAELLEERRAMNLLVHYSAYGYARWGLCGWLVRGVRAWRDACPGRRLITIFHELYATGPPWRVSFWSSHPQQQLARALARVSDSVITTSSASAAKLGVWSTPHRVHASPVFSNVGELRCPPSLAARSGLAVVFGQREAKRRCYAALLESQVALRDALQLLRIQRLIDIGPAADAPVAIAGAPVEVLGPLPASDVSAMLSDSRVGFLDYPRHVLAKSGILAAYLAHGMLAVNLSLERAGGLEFNEGHEFVYLNHLNEPEFDAEGVASAGHAWYRQHDLVTTALLVKNRLS